MKHKKMREKTADNILGYALIAPALILVTLIGIIPIFNTFLYSLQDYKLVDLANRKFVGLENYIFMFTENDYFFESLTNTLVFTFFNVIGAVVIGYIGALLMHKATRGVTLVRAAILIPWAIPGVIVATMFKFIFNDQLGVLNQILMTVGLIDSNITWLADGTMAMAAVIITDIWKQFPFVALMLLAGLQTIPGELYEAAQVDGAGKVKQFFSITLPSIRPVLLVVLLFRTMAALRIFDIVFSMTGGGPANATTTLLLQSYNYYFRDLDYGLGSAMATIIFLIIMAMSILYIKVFRSDED